MAADGFKMARELAEWKGKIKHAWAGVQLRAVTEAASEIGFHDSVPLEVDVTLNGLAPSDVRVECVVHRAMCSELTLPIRRYAENGHALAGVTYIDGETVLMAAFTAGVPNAEGVCRYRLELKPPWAGTLHYEIRAVPQHAHMTHPYELGLMRRL